ncbi:MAG TPA: acyl-CoA carboxylase epsilon subunit [Acidimicrobiia bacterium]|nr:acyl-CoA carboxylase epsilon subunit [Acidimicrobiia bacterium]
MASPGPRLRVISPDATPQEVAAIVAAVAACTPQHRPAAPVDQLDEWVRTARLRAHRGGLRRGSWRLSGRRPGRSRA